MHNLSLEKLKQETKDLWDAFPYTQHYTLLANVYSLKKKEKNRIQSTESTVNK